MPKTIYIGNLPWAVTNEDLAEAAGQHAEVISARVATDRETGRSRGFGFVEVPDEQAQTVIDALNGAEWEGRALTVNEAKPREERPAGGGGYRGGGGGGYGGGRGGGGGYGGGGGRGGGYGGGGRDRY
ncbi:MAG: RNA recognition motif domain-containing protein [Mycobacterium leprae]